MFFSEKLVEDLVVAIAGLGRLDLETLAHLIYHLKLPGDGVPRTIAQVIAERPNLNIPQSRLPGRLAYGVVDDGLALFDLAQRNLQHKRLCRQVNRIRLRLKELDNSAAVIDDFEEKLKVLLFVAASVRDLAATKRRFAASEMAVLAEQLLQGMLSQAELTRLLIERMAHRLRSDEKSCLALRLKQTVGQGLRNTPWDDVAHKEPLCTPADPVRFRLSLVQHPGFAEAAWDTIQQAEIVAKH